MTSKRLNPVETPRLQTNLLNGPAIPRPILKKAFLVSLSLAALLVGGPLATIATGQASLQGDWSKANRDSVAIAPDPVLHPDAVVQVYAARAFSWRGAFGVHTWIALKDRGEASYEVVEVIGWRARSGRPVVASSRRAPDARWFGSDPNILLDLRGERAATLIEPIRSAARRYPFPDRYEVWPGPNSNTFVAWVVREVDGLELELPVTAVGKDYLHETVLAPAPSRTGYQLSLGGLMGIMLARDEGLEFNVLGLSFGIDFADPALKLPGIGRIGVHQGNQSATYTTDT